MSKESLIYAAHIMCKPDNDPEKQEDIIYIGIPEESWQEIKKDPTWIALDVNGKTIHIALDHARDVMDAQARILNTITTVSTAALTPTGQNLLDALDKAEQELKNQDKDESLLDKWMNTSYGKEDE